MMTRLAIAAHGLFLLLPAVQVRAHESSSKRYTNLSLGGGQAAIAAAPAPKAARSKPAAPRAAAPAAATPAPPSSKAPWAAALGLSLAAAALTGRRLARLRRRADDETLALAAHELKSPLAAIESYLDLMAAESPAATPTDRQRLEDLGRMRTTTSHLRNTIAAILEMTRAPDGRMKLSARPLELAALIDESIAAYAAHAASRGVALRAHVPAGLSPALADPDRLRQILDNLLGNAIKFTPPSRAVDIRATQTPSRILLEVCDEGIGVPAPARARLFHKFQRLSPAVDGTEGTGLGLYLSRRLAAAQGGRLDYEPGAAGGSVFRVTLPRA